DVGARLVFVAQVVPQFRGAAGSQRDHLVREMGVVSGGFAMAESSQRFHHRILPLRLPSVDDVVYFGDVAEVRMIPFAIRRGDPAAVAVGIAVQLAKSKAPPRAAELPTWL